MDYSNLEEVIMKGDEEKVTEIVENLLDEGVGAKKIIDEGIRRCRNSVCFREELLALHVSIPPFALCFNR